MKLKELKCKNCGATLKVEEEVAQVKCEFCHTTFAVEDAYHDGYKFEKGRMKAHSEQFEKNLEHAKGIIGPIGKIFAAQYIISAVAAIVIFTIVVIAIITMLISQNNKREEFNNKKDTIINDMKDEIKEDMNKYEIKSFNSTFELYVGTEYGSSVGRLIDKISTNNKKDKNHQVTIKYKDTETKDPEIMKDLKKQFDEWTEYEVSFEYDENGLIYLAVIED